MAEPLKPFQSSRGRRRLNVVLRDTGETISPQDVARLLRTTSNDAAKILARWVEQGWMSRIRRGVYAPIPLEISQNSTVLANPWVVVPALFSPGYIGGWSAAEHWHLTEQVFQDVCVLTTKKIRRKTEEVEQTTFVATRIPERAYFGLRTVWVGSTKVPISDPHKTIVDMLSHPTLGGGIRHVASCLETCLGREDFDRSTLISYAGRLGNGAVFKRLGFLASRCLPDDDPLLQACSNGLTQGLAQLDPSQLGRRIITRWRLRIPPGWEARH